jgi:hypothetical protein
MTDIIIKRGPNDPAPIEGEVKPPDLSNKPVPPANPKKEGAYYDVCPADACIEVDRIHKCGGTTGYDVGSQEYLDWSMFSADRRKGGCGALWARTTRQGQELHDQRGMGPAKWLTRSATRSLSVPSQAYMDNYDRIFKKGPYAENVADRG